ncbi:MAG: cbb3-type cytochrome c oxidase subunit I [Verrucomicrobiales bacterium]
MSSTSPGASPQDMQERAAIDRSVRFPVMFFFTSAAAWLFAATILGMVAALKLRVPTLWDACPWLSFGRIFPAHMDALIYGWAMQAGLGIMIWMMARLSRVELRNATYIIVLGHVWNFGVALGVLAVWSGFGNSRTWLDFPSMLWPMLAATYVLIVVTILVMFRVRRDGPVFISEEYLVAAAVWFPWVYVTANLILGAKGSAVMSAGVTVWYMQNLLYFWLIPIAVAIAYYIIPKVVGRPIYSYPLAKFGFWTLAICAGWMGFQRFYGGPFPAWMPAVGGASTIFALIGITAIAVNLFYTMQGKFSLMQFSPSLRFSLFGMAMLLLFAVLSALKSFIGISKYLQFNLFELGLDTLAIYGVFSMAAFGAIYFIVPRITGCEWPHGGWIRRHFWFSTYGILTVLVGMFAAGLSQGASLDAWDTPFEVSVKVAKPWIVALVLGWVFIAFSNLGFFWQLALMFVGKGRRSEGPTLIHVAPGEAASAEQAANVAKGTAHA